MVTSLEGTGSKAIYGTASPLSQGAGGVPVGDVGKTTATKVNAEIVSAQKQTVGESSAVSKVVSQFVALQAEKDAGNEAAKVVRQIDVARETVDQMRESLTRIVKMYPPYAKDDPARAQLMQSVVGLRQVTEQLTIPPAYSLLLKGATDLPGLQDVNASDAQVADALSSLDAVSASLATESKKLFSSAVPSEPGGINGDQEAGRQSRDVGNSLGGSRVGISSDAGGELIRSFID